MGVADTLSELRRKKAQLEQAIARLDDAFLFATEAGAMARSEYLVKRAEILRRLGKLDAEIGAGGRAAIQHNVVADVDLFSRFLLLHSLLKADDIREQLPSLDRAVVRDFLQQTISYIEVNGDQVTKIVFHSPDGEDVHRFIYKA